MFKLYTPNKYKKEADGFFSAYQLEAIFLCEVSNKKELVQKNLRKCRFCGRSIANTTFNNEAHLIPELLGNKKLYSDFECDACNSFFSNYESNLTNFIGITRALQKVNAKK